MLGDGREILLGPGGSESQTHLEPGGAPVHELNGPLGLEGG
jgi:hypothetical protein